MMWIRSQVDSALSAKANQATTYAKTEAHDAVGPTTNKSDVAIASGGKNSASNVNTKKKLMERAKTCYKDQ